MLTTMRSLITSGIRVTVDPLYLPEESMPVQNRYVFAYRITIENQSTSTVQLLRRHWYIVESNGLRREVEGEGVIGLQPVLAPGKHHQYTSWCPIITDMGKMYGAFQMIRVEDGSTFEVDIPEFHLVPPFKMN